MHAKVHKEMALQVIEDYPNANLLRFLIEGVAKPEWKKDMKTKVKWLKEWMDMPDNKKHSSKMKNDHSYKIEKTDKGFKIKFIGGRGEQATVIARLKYDSRDIKEWKVEEELRASALELAKSIHWVVDFSTPPHTTVGWSDKEHSEIEKDFDKLWKEFYDKDKINFGRKKEIKDIYRWAKKFVEDRYERNMKLLALYRSGGSIKDTNGKNLGKEVICDVAQNLADYLSYQDRVLDFGEMAGLLKE